MSLTNIWIQYTEIYEPRINIEEDIKEDNRTTLKSQITEPIQCIRYGWMVLPKTVDHGTAKDV